MSDLSAFRHDLALHINPKTVKEIRASAHEYLMNCLAAEKESHADKTSGVLALATRISSDKALAVAVLKSRKDVLINHSNRLVEEYDSLIRIHGADAFYLPLTLSSFLDHAQGPFVSGASAGLLWYFALGLSTINPVNLGIGFGLAVHKFQNPVLNILTTEGYKERKAIIKKALYGLFGPNGVGKKSTAYQEKIGGVLRKLLKTGDPVTDKGISRLISSSLSKSNYAELSKRRLDEISMFDIMQKTSPALTKLLEFKDVTREAVQEMLRMEHEDKGIHAGLVVLLNGYTGEISARDEDQCVPSWENVENRSFNVLCISRLIDHWSEEETKNEKGIDASVLFQKDVNIRMTPDTAALHQISMTQNGEYLFGLGRLPANVLSLIPGGLSHSDGRLVFKEDFLDLMKAISPMDPIEAMECAKNGGGILLKLEEFLPAARICEAAAPFLFIRAHSVVMAAMARG